MHLFHNWLPMKDEPIPKVIKRTEYAIKYRWTWLRVCAICGKVKTYHCPIGHWAETVSEEE